jgi:hypothetical protein
MLRRQPGCSASSRPLRWCGTGPSCLREGCASPAQTSTGGSVVPNSLVCIRFITMECISAMHPSGHVQTLIWLDVLTRRVTWAAGEQRDALLRGRVLPGGRAHVHRRQFLRCVALTPGVGIARVRRPPKMPALAHVRLLFKPALPWPPLTFPFPRLRPVPVSLPPPPAARCRPGWRLRSRHPVPLHPVLVTPPHPAPSAPALRAGAADRRLRGPSGGL